MALRALCTQTQSRAASWRHDRRGDVYRRPQHGQRRRRQSGAGHRVHRPLRDRECPAYGLGRPDYKYNLAISKNIAYHRINVSANSYLPCRLVAAKPKGEDGSSVKRRLDG